MNKVVDGVMTAVSAIDPNAPMLKAAEAVIATVANPSPSTLVADFALALQLVEELKEKLAGTHPSIINIVKALF